MLLLAHAGSPDELAATLLIFGGVTAGWVAWTRLRLRMSRIWWV